MSTQQGSALIQKISFTMGTVMSRDGTKIGYRQAGHGPGIVLVQGAMGTAYNYDQLATDLASDFTVYVPDRRGRGMSPREYDTEHSIQNYV
jgi:pimeloyl-ACP methyl ester carboxylesterase